MKQFTLFMALVALTATGCVQNKVFGPLAGKNKKQNVRADLDAMSQGQSDIQLTAYGDCCECPDDCCGGDDCCGMCSGDSCCGDPCCGDGCCDSGKCRSGGMGDRCRGMGGRMMGCNPHAVGYPEPQNFNPSPPTGQVAYPYYTVRGPRDFLRNNPPSIGPY